MKKYAAAWQQRVATRRPADFRFAERAETMIFFNYQPADTPVYLVCLRSCPVRSLEWKHTVAGADPAAGEICARATWKYFTARYIFCDGAEFFISPSFLLLACFPFAKLIVNEGEVTRVFSSTRGKRETIAEDSPF